MIKGLQGIALTVLLGSALGLVGVVSGPALAAPAPEDFGQRVQVFDAAISPDGSQLALIQNSKGDYIVRIVDLENPGGQMRAIGLGEGVRPKYVKWVNDGRVMVSVRRTQKQGSTVFNTSFLFSLDTDTMKGRLLIKPKDGFRQFNDRVLDWLEDDPDHIVMEFADDGDDQLYPDVRKVHVGSGRSSVLKRQSNQISEWVTDGSGEPVVGLGTRRGGQEAYMIVRRPGTDDWDSFRDYPGLDPETQRVVAATDEGRSLVLSAYRGKDTRGLHRYDLVNRQFADVIYENPEYDVGSVILSKDGERIVGASFTGETEERVLFDAYDSTFEEALALLEGYQVDFIDQNADSTQLILRVSAPHDPGALYLYRRGQGLTKIADNYTGLKAGEMGEVLAVRYTARDGARIPSYVTIPSGFPAGESPKNLPFIVMPHGGPYARDEKRFDYMAQFFASQGYGVLQMNFRGSEGFGKAFADAGRNNWVVMQEDVEDGMRWLLEKGYADPDTSCIAGWSYGGYAALMGAAKDPDLYNCVIAIAPLTDIRDAARDMRDYANGRAAAKRFFGGMLDDKALMKANNPVDQAANISVPVYLAHGTRDTNVEFDQFTRMKRSLEKAGVKGTYRRFDDEDHFMSEQANRQTMLKDIAKFLKAANGKSAYAPD